MPPLRERKDDIPVLCQHFLEKYCNELGKHIKKISGEAMGLLVNYRYPGNIRELENIIERTVALEPADIILPETLPDYMRSSEIQELGTSEVQVTPDGLDFEKAVENFERSIVLKAIEKADGVQKKAAEILKISPRSLRYLLQKYGIER